MYSIILYIWWDGAKDYEISDGLKNYFIPSRNSVPVDKLLFLRGFTRNSFADGDMKLEIDKELFNLLFKYKE
jgi:hypothetical protein